MARDALLDLAKSEKPDDRRRALRGLVYCADRETRNRALQAALSDPCVPVRSWAAFLLVTCERDTDGDARARRLVLADPVPSVRMHAAFYSFQIRLSPPAEFFPIFVAALNAEDAWSRASAAEYLEDLLDQESISRSLVIDALLECLDNEHEEIRVPAARGLAYLEVRPSKVHAALRRHLQDSDYMVAHFCRRAVTN